MATSWYTASSWWVASSASQLTLQEAALDFSFLTLGIDTSTIEHPIVMTERLANPLFTRASAYAVSYR